MANETEIYEQRQVSLRSGGLAAYAANVKEQVWPDINRQGARVLCLFDGFIGEPRGEVTQITRLPNRETWNDCQNIGAAGEHELVEKEEVRLLTPIAIRPKEFVPPEDRRAVYGFRTQLIRSRDVEEFAHCSENGVWPRIESQGACILGLWSTLADTDPKEVILLTGYHGPGHWEETRVTQPKPEDVDPALWQGDLELRARREQITLKTWVNLMQSVEISPHG